jgi:large subunit ribosomal protein L21
MTNNKENFAVIETDGRQYKVKPGINITVHRLSQSPQEKISFDKVLLASINSDPTKVSVTGEIVSHYRGDKVRIIKFKRRKHHLKRRGFKSSLTSVKILSINSIG